MNSKIITIGISSCLVGLNVRYDGENKREDFLLEKLQKHALLIPICPEVEMGMPVPRERLLLQGDINKPTMIGDVSGKKLTNAMIDFSNKRILKSDFRNFSGLILKSKSPSCGIKTTKLYSDKELIAENATGLFASTVQQTYPLMPIIDELSLSYEDVFQEFIAQVSEYAKSS